MTMSPAGERDPGSLPMTGVLVAAIGPQALAFIALCCAAGDLTGLADGISRGVRVHLEV
jgi:hypothetical protein